MAKLKGNEQDQTYVSRKVSTKSKAQSTNLEIDDIFSSKKNKQQQQQILKPDVEPVESDVKKGKRKEPISLSNVAKNGNSSDTNDLPPIQKTRPASATVIVLADPSVKLDSYRPSSIAEVLNQKKRKKGDATGGEPEDEASQKLMDEELAFMDSRGVSRRKTDDGLPIYDVKELNIGLGGDTPLCPFDCTCCF